MNKPNPNLKVLISASLVTFISKNHLKYIVKEKRKSELAIHGRKRCLTSSNTDLCVILYLYNRTHEHLSSLNNRVEVSTNPIPQNFLISLG
ncbi:hypothetical protein Patl1_30380 [Pistacia atlantica]|uniref:Uncharacterized protein n=1 Tax=Pistacia atlantica TaxID=434234 RepID=A0ACC1AE22_9ROSI|nr:hypothetical protein Patl1_30380 [Pistacia atlantica]